ncbi:hypothetical protein TrST_g9211 [Triparma strigata]|uniref:Uncharacterized protein n=1 Tax=Triparma strigata TaxID=1606541 RepID=A0A9W7AYS2_9STRA|nr:hypothetical protein TrST_g9211 [Triparma strigata]
MSKGCSERNDKEARRSSLANIIHTEQQRSLKENKTIQKRNSKAQKDPIYLLDPGSDLDEDDGQLEGMDSRILTTNTFTNNRLTRLSWIQKLNKEAANNPINLLDSNSGPEDEDGLSISPPKATSSPNGTSPPNATSSPNEEVFDGLESGSDSAADETPAVGGDDFMHTDDFRRLFVGFVMVDTLVAMRWLDRKWHKVVEKKLTEVENEPFGEIIVHGGNDVSLDEACSDARIERLKQVTKVVFLLNITKVGDYACTYADNLIAVDIPEGITSIGDGSFADCSSLKEISFPKSLTSIGDSSFYGCKSLEEVDLLHTNVQELGGSAFWDCTSLREMKVPDSLQKFGTWVFAKCSNLVPSDIQGDKEAVVAYLRSIQ